MEKILSVPRAHFVQVYEAYKSTEILREQKTANDGGGSCQSTLKENKEWWRATLIVALNSPASHHDGVASGHPVVTTSPRF